MFGDMMGMMGKLKEAQAKLEEAKKRLDTVMIEEKSSGDHVKVVISANRSIKSIDIDPEILDDKEVLEDYLILALNKAISKASEVQEKELSAVAKEGMPNIPGMDLFK
jgi:DNA-binding YbaB/EbfC family protein